MLYELSAKLNYVYFPTAAIVSMLYVLESRALAGIDVIGKEAILALPINFGVKSLIAIKK